MNQVAIASTTTNNALLNGIEHMPMDAARSESVQELTRSRLIKIAILTACIVAFMAIVNLALQPRALRCSKISKCERVRRMNTIFSAVRSIVNIICPVVYLISTMSIAGVDIRAVVMTTGVIGLVIGLAVQPTLKSMIAGINVAAYNEYSIGDLVTIVTVEIGNEYTGYVVKFDSIRTVLRDFKGGVYYIKNNQIALSINKSQNEQRAEVNIKVSTEVPVDTMFKQTKILLDSINKDSALIGKMNKTPILKGITAADQMYYTITVFAQCVQGTQFLVERYLRQRILELLQHMGVSSSALVTSNNTTGNNIDPTDLQSTASEMLETTYSEPVWRGTSSAKDVYVS